MRALRDRHHGDSPPGHRPQPARAAGTGTARLGRPHGENPAQDPHRLRHLPRLDPREPRRARGINRWRAGALNGARRVRREAARKRPGFTQHEHGTSPGGPPYSSYSSHIPLTCGYALRGGIWGRRRPLCVRPLGAGGEVTHGRARTAASGGRAFTPRSGPLWPLTCGVQDAFLLSPSSSPPGSGSVSLVPRASVMRWLAASAWPSVTHDVGPSGSRVSPVPVRQPSMRPGWCWILRRPVLMTCSR